MDYHAYLHKLWVSGIMESVESNNFYRLGTTLTTGLLAKLHLAVSQSLLAQEDIAWLWVACGEKLDKIKIKNSTKLFSVTQLTQVTQRLN